MKKLLNDKQKELLIKMEALAEFLLLCLGKLSRSGKASIDEDELKILSQFYCEDYEKVFNDNLYEGYEESIAPRSTNNGENMDGFAEYCYDSYASEMDGILLSISQTKHD